MKTLYLILFTALFLIVSASCDKENEENKIIEITLKSQKIVEADNAFGLDIFKRIHEEEEEANFMISPLSISMALTMAYNGAETETKDEMAEMLFIDDFTREKINETYKELIEYLVSVDAEVAMEIANSIWYKDGYPVEQNFLDINQKYYDAEVTKADFDDPKTVDFINQWVSDNTHEKIPEIINEIPSMAVLYLINAIYFNGTWSQEFNPENTEKLMFRTADDDLVQTDMMSRIDTLNYFSNAVFSAVEMPYGKGKFNMMVLLPNSENTVDHIISELTPENWTEWQNEFELTNNVDILFPKFKIEYEITLNEVLKAMEMQQAFTSQADFSSININKDLFISLVKHKTFVEVDEEGTEAAAVTIISFDTTSVDPNAPIKTYFHCVKPFLFAITEKDTGSILFIGKVANPSLE